MSRADGRRRPGALGIKPTNIPTTVQTDALQSIAELAAILANASSSQTVSIDDQRILIASTRPCEKPFLQQEIPIDSDPLPANRSALRSRSSNCVRRASRTNVRALDGTEMKLSHEMQTSAAVRGKKSIP